MYTGELRVEDSNSIYPPDKVFIIFPDSQPLSTGYVSIKNSGQ